MEGPAVDDPEVLEHLHYPIGRFHAETGLSAADRDALIDEIAHLPDKLREVVSGLSPEQLNTPYRPGGWTVRQVVHHVPDSHLNGYVRFKWAVTEDDPQIKVYDQGAWAELADADDEDVAVSLALLDALHRRWTRFLRSLDPKDFERPFQHPELGRVTLETNLQLYAWHGRHHVAHIATLRDRMGWR